MSLPINIVVHANIVSVDSYALIYIYIYRNLCIYSLQYFLEHAKISLQYTLLFKQNKNIFNLSMNIMV